ncbi:unnamed protein product [Gongylonema pulchrum]|uniref:Myosin motor domain-containing protein n=1 Tax=Gongylonema pulchrum TaxID=637853 RepID=A0A183ETH7_9BILA|nr:unnamed protein product [Gongylonema pulchrum]
MLRKLYVAEGIRQRLIIKDPKREDDGLLITKPFSPFLEQIKVLIHAAGPVVPAYRAYIAILAIESSL